MTAITISPGNEHDGHHAAALVEQQPASRRPQRVIGDTAYGNIEVREQLEQRATRVLAPLHTTRAADATRSTRTSSRSTSPRAGHLPAGQDGADLPTPPQRPARRRNPRRALHRRATASPARCASAAPRRPPPDPHQPPRRPPPSRAAPTRRPRPTRPPQTHPATHRTAARTDRLPLPRPHQPLQRRPQDRTPSRLDRHPGQPAPDRDRTTSPDPLTRGPDGDQTARKRQANRPKRAPPWRSLTADNNTPTSSRHHESHTHAANDFFSGLVVERAHPRC